TIVCTAAHAHSCHRRDQSYPHTGTKGFAEEGTCLSFPDTAASGAGARRQASPETLAARSRSAPSVRACHRGLNVDDSCESTFAATRVISAPISRPGASRNYARAYPKHSWGRPSGGAGSARYAWSGFFSTEPFCLTGNEGKTRWGRKANYCCDAHLPASTSGDARVSSRKADVS